MSTTPKTPEELFALFDELGIEHETIEHEPVFTAEESNKISQEIPGLDCKNLFMKSKNGSLWLALLPGEKRANINRIAKKAESGRLSFGKPDLLLEVLGITPGSVTPFALWNDTDRRVHVIVDEDIIKSPMVNFHPMHNAASTALKTEDLLRFIRHLGYDPLFMDCGHEI